MALVKTSSEILLIRGQQGGHYFKHSPDGQHIQAMPRSVRKASMNSIKVYGGFSLGNRSGNIGAFSGMSGLWMLALLSFFGVMWAAYAIANLFTDKKGEEKRITGYNWYIYYAMMFPETERPPLWKPPHGISELPDHIVTTGDHGFYEHPPDEWPLDLPAGYYWPGMECNGKPSWRTDDFEWFIWWKDPMWVISKSLGWEDPPTTYYSPSDEIWTWYRNPVTGKRCHVYIGKPAE